MKIFKNKFFLTVLSIALFLTILTATLSLMGQTDPICGVLNTLSIPFRYAANAAVDAFEGFSAYFAAIENERAENEELRAELESLRAELADRDAALEENNRLREYLEMKQKYSDFKLTEALIIGREGDSHATFFTLNKGKNDGVDIGMAVMVNEGLVGSVCDAGDGWSRVRVLNEASSSAGAYVGRSGEIGVLSGDISFKDKGYCILKYLPEDADVVEGDLVYTSGEGSVYPGEIYIGRVISVESDGFSRSKSATVECAVDFDSLKYVVVITAYQGGGDQND